MRIRSQAWPKRWRSERRPKPICLRWEARRVAAPHSLPVRPAEIHGARNRRGGRLRVVSWHTATRGGRRGAGRGAAGSVVGYVYAGLEPQSWKELREACGFIHDVVVDERGRRTGVATALIDAAAEWLRARRSARDVVDGTPERRRAATLRAPGLPSHHGRDDPRAVSAVSTPKLKSQLPNRLVLWKLDLGR